MKRKKMVALGKEQPGNMTGVRVWGQCMVAQIIRNCGGPLLLCKTTNDGLAGPRDNGEFPPFLFFFFFSMNCKILYQQSFKEKTSNFFMKHKEGPSGL